MKLITFLAFSLVAITSSFADTGCEVVIAERDPNTGKTAIHGFGAAVSIDKQKIFLGIRSGGTMTGGQPNWQFVHLSLSGFYGINRQFDSTAFGRKENAVIMLDLENGMKEDFDQESIRIISTLTKHPAVGDLKRFIRSKLNGDPKDRFSGYITGKSKFDGNELFGVLLCKIPKEKK